MCSDYKDSFIDFISECSIRILPHNITEKSLTFFLSTSYNIVGLKVSVIVWDRTQGWTLTRTFAAKELVSKVLMGDVATMNDVYDSIVGQIDQLIDAMIQQHPEYLKQTIRQFHALERL